MNNVIDAFSVPHIKIYLMAFVFLKFCILICSFLHNRFVKFTLFVTVYKFIQWDSKFVNANNINMIIWM